ncbi:hypothetical protein XELAEV_18023982mg [Xenopus laevis]|uniref:Uncharacterized protein n=1 Tax=Xenopus laevis TaxID=8355 RepID=A0A974D620_XENLA|nr:hypothetical protein XELAEV_18023982mg [Xenopus laevis]
MFFGLENCCSRICHSCHYPCFCIRNQVDLNTIVSNLRQSARHNAPLKCATTLEFCTCRKKKREIFFNTEFYTLGTLSHIVTTHIFLCYKNVLDEYNAAVTVPVSQVERQAPTDLLAGMPTAASLGFGTHVCVRPSC